MKKLLVIIWISVIGWAACDTGTNTSEATEGQKQAMKQETKKQETMEKRFSYAAGDAEETITVQFTPDGKEVVSATHHTAGGDTHAITFIDMAYADDLDMFMGGATSPAWDSEAMIGIESDFSRLGWNDGKSKKSFLR